MKKKQIIKKSSDFTEIINNGKKIRNKYYTIFYIKDKEKLFGISIPTKTGTAVIRNKIKRQIKNIIDNNQKSIKNNCKYVIIIRKEILELSYQSKEKELISLFEKLGEENDK